MIITRTPLRVSFFGGGTDYPDYYLRYGGATLATAIDKYITVLVQPLPDYFPHRYEVHYSRLETVRRLDEIVIPNVRETLRHAGISDGLEIHLVGDLPARSGLGSSSATTVGLLAALRGLQGKDVDPEQLATEALQVEQRRMAQRVGSQDQYICAIGGFLHLRFEPGGPIAYAPVPLTPARLAALEAHLMLFYTGVQRDAHDVLDDQLSRTREGLLDDHLAAMRAQVAGAVAILLGDGPLTEFGRLLAEAWTLKRALSHKISNSVIDALYARAQSAGALGGKLLGAGGGGFLLLFVEPARQPAVRAALAGLREVRLGLAAEGTRIVYRAP